MLNKVQLIGRLTNDPKSGTGSTSYAFISIACNNKYKDKEGNVKEAVEYINISCFSKLAEIVSNYCHKGDLLYIEGKIKSQNINQNGIKMTKVEIHAEKLRILSSPRNSYSQNENDLPEE